MSTIDPVAALTGPAPVKERPILFSAPMVRAILDGKKTQTRRVANVHDLKIETSKVLGEDFTSWSIHFSKPVKGAVASFSGSTGITHKQAQNILGAMYCPYGKPGDRLWVRENFARVPSTAYRMSTGVQQVVDPNDPDMCAVYSAGWERSAPDCWRPSIHMPRWASRILLEVTEVRVERLQDISEADAQAEGVEPNCTDDPLTCPSCRESGHCEAVGEYIHYGRSMDGSPAFSAKESFQSLWDSLADEKTNWNANPWVWVVGFKVLTPNPKSKIENPKLEAQAV